MIYITNISVQLPNSEVKKFPSGNVYTVSTDEQKGWVVVEDFEAMVLYFNENEPGWQTAHLE